MFRFLPALVPALALTLAPIVSAAQDTAPLTDETPPAPQEAPPEAPMSLQRLDQIIKALDPNARTNGIAWQMVLADVTVLIVTDEASNRMRAMVGIRPADGISPQEMTRMMQANFDSALDARYAIAQATLWAVFIHPLSALEKDEFISGLGQVVNLATSYGTVYSGGALQYGGGDSGALQRQLIDELLKKGEEI